MVEKFEKMFAVFEMVAFEYVGENSLNYDENT